MILDACRFCHVAQDPGDEHVKTVPGGKHSLAGSNGVRDWRGRSVLGQGGESCQHWTQQQYEDHQDRFPTETKSNALKHERVPIIERRLLNADFR